MIKSVGKDLYKRAIKKKMLPVRHCELKLSYEIYLHLESEAIQFSYTIKIKNKISKPGSLDCFVHKECAIFYIKMHSQ